MKCFRFILLLYLLPAYCISQQSAPLEVKGFAPFFLGDSIAKFGPLLSCMESPYLEQPYYDSATCRIYRYGSTQIDSFPVGPVTFFGVMLSGDKQKRINMLLYTKGYPNDQAGATEADLTRDITALRDYFGRLFGAVGQKKVYPKSKHNPVTGWIWKTGRVSLTLEEIPLNKKKGSQNRSLLYVTLLEQ